MIDVIPPGTAFGPGEYERLDELGRLMHSAMLRLEEIERSLTERAPASLRFYRARITEALAVIDSLWRLENAVPAGEIADWARRHFPETYASAARRALSDLALQGVDGTAANQVMHLRTLQAVLANFHAGIQNDLIVPLKASTIRTVRVVVSQAGFAADVAAGVVGGLPRRETSASLRRTLTRALTAALPDGAEPDLTHIEVGGRTMSAEQWSEMFARTETARASTASNRATCAENDVLHVQITTHSHPPCICTPFEGRIYRIYEDQGDPRFAWIGNVPNGGPPMHPNCVHREAPAVVELLEERGDLEGRIEVPEPFRGLDEKQLGQLVRQHAAELRRFSESRTGVLPENFRLRAAA